MPSHDGQKEEQDRRLCLRGGSQGKELSDPALWPVSGQSGSGPLICDSVSYLTTCLFFLCKTLGVMHLDVNVNVALTTRDGAPNREFLTCSTMSDHK